MRRFGRSQGGVDGFDGQPRNGGNDPQRGGGSDERRGAVARIFGGSQGGVDDFGELQTGGNAGWQGETQSDGQTASLTASPSGSQASFLAGDQGAAMQGQYAATQGQGAAMQGQGAAMQGQYQTQQQPYAGQYDQGASEGILGQRLAGHTRDTLERAVQRVQGVSAAAAPWGGQASQNQRGGYGGGSFQQGEDARRSDDGHQGGIWR